MWSFGEAATCLGLFPLFEERFLISLGCLLLPGKIPLPPDLFKRFLINTSQPDPCGGSNHVAGIHPPKWNPIYFEGSSNQKNTLGKMLEKNDPFSTESTSNKNQYSSGLQRRTRFRGLDGFPDLKVVPISACSAREAEIAK